MPNILYETVNGINPIPIEDELLNDRKIFMTEEFSSKSCSDIMKQLMYLEKKDAESDIFIYISSPGGEISSGLSLCDYIKQMKAPVNTVCIGTAASMGSILFLHGKRRIMMAHSRIMIHDPSFGQSIPAGEKPLEIQERVNKLMKTREDIAKIISERSGMSLDLVYEKTAKDTFLSAEEALETGIATEII